MDTSTQTSETTQNELPRKFINIDWKFWRNPINSENRYHSVLTYSMYQDGKYRSVGYYFADPMISFEITKEQFKTILAWMKNHKSDTTIELHISRKTYETQRITTSNI